MGGSGYLLSSVGEVLLGLTLPSRGWPKRVAVSNGNENRLAIGSGRWRERQRRQEAIAIRKALAVGSR